MVETLGKKAFNGVIWNLINKFGTQAIGIIPSMILARLLGPSEFGLIAAANIFTGVAYVVSTGSFCSALIQKKDTDHLDYCSVFYFNLFVNIALYCIFFLLSPFFSEFIGLPSIVPIMNVSLLSLPLLAIGQVHSVIMRKELNFRIPAIRNLLVQLISSIIAIVLALLGFGVWSIVVQGILQTLLGSVVNWMLCKWRPTLVFSKIRLKSMFSFSMNIYANNVFHYFFTKGYDTVIVKFYNEQELSYYNRAFSTINLVISTATGAINTTVFPVLSKLQNDKERLKSNLRRYILIENLFVTFILFLSFVLSEPIFRFLYSSKWDAVIPLFKILCIWGLFVPLKSILENALMALGNSGILLRNAIINKLLIIVILAVGWNWGVVYIVSAQILTIIQEVFIYCYYLKRKIEYSMKDIFVDIAPTYIQLLVVFALVYCFDMMTNAFSHIITDSEIIISIIRLLQGISFSLLLFILSNYFFENKAFIELTDFFFNNYPHYVRYKKYIIWR